jgi:acetyl esterase/lipase
MNCKHISNHPIKGALMILCLFLITPLINAQASSDRANLPDVSEEKTAAQDLNKDRSYSKKTYVYKEVDNHQIHADVYRYPGSCKQAAIIWIHGGALIFGSRTGIPEEQLEFYMNAGYTVVAIDYRLAPETKLPGIIQDLEDAYTWVVSMGPDLYGIDPERIAVVGHSAGGFLTLMAGWRTTPTPRALVSFYGYGDITGPWYAEPDPFYCKRPAISKEIALQSVGDSILSGASVRTPDYNRGNFYLYCRQNGLWPLKVAGEDPHKKQEWFRQYESIQNISGSYPPTILLHGENDTDVPFGQSEMFAAELKKMGIPYQFIRHKEWGHGFDRAGLEDPLVGAAFKDILNFLEVHMK